MAKNNKEDYGSFGKGIDKRGRTYYYEKSKTGGFGIIPIKEDKFKKLLKEKQKSDRQALASQVRESKKASVAMEKAKAKQEADEKKRIEQVRIDTEKRIKEARRKKEEAGIEDKPSLTDSQIARAKLAALAEKLSKDLNHVVENRNQIFQNYSKFAQDKMYKVITGRLLRLFGEYDTLSKQIEAFCDSIKRKVVWDRKYQEQASTFLKRIDVLDNKQGILEIDVNNTFTRVEKEKRDKEIKEDAKRDKIYLKDQDRKSKLRQKRIDAVSNGRAQQGFERKSATRERRLAAVAEGREAQEQIKEAKIQALMDRRKKVDDFFDLSRSSMLLMGGKVGGFFGATVGRALGGAGRTLGLDFSQEGGILSGLFSPIKGLAGLGLKGVKSLTQDSFGVHDQDIEDQIEKINGSKPKVQTTKQAPSKPTPKPMMSVKNGLKGISKNTSNKFSNVKNFFSGNPSSSSNSSIKNNSSTSNTTNNSGDQFQNTDFNRTDDNIDKELVSPIVELLEKILKEIKKGNDDPKKNGGGMFGGLGKAGLIGAAAAGAVVLGNYIHNEWKNMFGDSNSESNIDKATETTNNVMTKKLREMGASPEDIEEMETLTRHEMAAVSSNDKAELKFIREDKKKLLGKYGINNIFGADNDSTSTNNSNSSSSNFKNTNSDVSIKSKISKIEKIQDAKDNGAKDDIWKKFFTEIFIPKMADSIANSLSNRKGAGKSFMPPVDPF